MNPQCARCGKIVYPTEKVNCLDKYWHKGCFHCEVCKMTLNMNNYKGYDKKPYCNSHYPKQSFTTVADTPENLRLKQQSELQSQVKYKKDFEESKGRGFSIVTDTPELQRLRKTQEQISNVKYKEEFEKDLKERKHQYNPQDSASFKQAQAASVWASEVQYKTDLQELHDPSSDLPNSLYLGHALQASKLQSMFEYKKQYEKSKGHYHLALDTAERLHHKENAVLQSQVKYKEDYEKSKGKSMLEFVDTQAYQVSKGVQKIQSEKEYRKDLEEGIKGKGLTLLEDTPDLIRVKNAAWILNEKEYRKDLENEIKGKGMELSADIPDIQRAKKASHMASEKEYRKDLENEIKGKGIQLSTGILEIERATRATEITSQVSYKQMSELRQNTYGTVTDTPEMLHAAHVKDIYNQKKYRDEADKMKCSFASVADTVDMQRVKNSQKNISSFQYTADSKLLKGTVSSVADTPEIILAKENSKRISNVFYKEGVGTGIPVRETPEMDRVKKNQQNISMVKYNSDLKELKGKPCVIVDTPEMRRVRENQNNISMVRYHEDFEKTRGKGFTPVVDDPNFERVRRNTQVSSEAAYKGVHPHVVEMDRRPGIIVEKASRCSRQLSQTLSPVGMSVGDESSEISEKKPSLSCYSVNTTRTSDDGAPVLPGAYHQGGQSPGFGYMHQTSIASMKSMGSPPHSATIRTYRAIYDYAAQDHDEVSFRDGDIIMNVQSIDQGWMYGTVQRTGHKRFVN
ncbi:Nebulette [Acipenser ruthenus]|uniref:Nebulette n=1 Tax=Acipenser ruthenus TaxID=7906 RepID=A0A444U3H0_ACIRT|nr:Nebulette [Acipenser ruthenus]